MLLQPCWGHMGGKTPHSSAWHCFSLPITHQKSQLALVGGSDIAPIGHPSVLQHKARRMHGGHSNAMQCPTEPQQQADLEHMVSEQLLCTAAVPSTPVL